MNELLAVSIVVTDHGDGTQSATAVLTGDLDASNAREFETTVRSAAVAAQLVVIDLRAVDIVDSAGLGALVRLRRWLRERDAVIETWIVGEDHQRIFAVTGLETHLGVTIAPTD